MSRAFAFIGAVVPALVIPGATFADTSAASACAADLPAEPKAIYDRPRRNLLRPPIRAHW